MNAPVQSAATQLRGFLDKDNWWVGLFEEDNVETESEEAHYCSEILRPSPAEAGIHYCEATYEWS